MCLAVPARLVEIRDGDLAVVDLDGVRKEVSVAFLDAPQVGEYVLIHVGIALQKIDTDEAEETLRLFRALAASQPSAAADVATDGWAGATAQGWV